MSSLSGFGYLARTEDGPLRDPLVVIFHLPYALLLAGAYIVMAEKNMVTTIYFSIAVLLYVSSTAYHYRRPNDFTRKCDQTMIGLYINVTPLPFIYQEWWGYPLFLLLSSITIVNKWCDWEQWEQGYESSSLIFLSMGAVSTFLVLFFGIPNLRVMHGSTDAFLIYVGILCFFGKWAIYHHGWYWPTGWQHLWAAPECGHFVLSIGVAITTYYVVMYPL